MRLTAGLDSGPVCLEGRLPILASDTYGSLAARLQELAGELILRALRERPPFREQAQTGVTYAEKIGPRDRLLDPARPALELERVVRALHPHIGARVALAGGEPLGVRSAALADVAGEGPAPGLRVRDGRLLLSCTPGVLELLEVQPAGGRAMATADYLRGRPAGLA
jgi:methionyl-tRNA formyltransferase